MTDFENTYYYQFARTQFNLNRIKQENEMLKNYGRNDSTDGSV